MPKKKIDFESALARLEEISEIIEDTDASLENSLKLYKEAVELSVFCSESLNDIEKQVMILQKTSEKAFEKKPFAI